MAIKILAFPFAGGNKYSFQFIAKQTEQFKTFDYPGHGGRMKESLFTDIQAIADDLFLKIKEELQEPYILFGHSMGALVAYLICQKIEAYKLPLPLKLVVSGKKAPTLEPDNLLADLPDDTFWEELIKLGGVPASFVEHIELKNMFTSILKADFCAVENYEHRTVAKLSIPIDVFYGASENISALEAKAWGEETSGPVNVTCLKGDHFFINEHEDYFKQYFLSK